MYTRHTPTEKKYVKKELGYIGKSPTKGLEIVSAKKNAPNIPDHVIESLARCILPKIKVYFESDEGQKEFAE